MTVEQRVDQNNDQFPVGMRVLAVDDDPTCLKLLETLLRKCQYQATTTSQAVIALKLLRENKDKFDLVISDVHMPDMDGFKLLELVGLEMDLPVIMLSSYGDTKLVMKGITHGACDYLLKPVRMEELKNIWQHVIRRKKLDLKDQKTLEQHHGESGVVSEGFVVTGDSDKSEKLNRKRKDQNVEDDEEGEEDGQDEDPSTQKKPRVVWSVELHRKFVAAVNQLGIDKAVPKRILELMNVEKLTRENVASHLQKYRLYLKRISSVASQQPNMVAAFGGPDATYLRTTTLSGFGNLPNFSGTAHLQNGGLRTFPTGSVLERLNAASGLGIHGLSSPGIGQLVFQQNCSNTVNNLNNFHTPVQAGDQSGNAPPSIPLSLDLDLLQHHEGVSHTGEHVNTSNESMVYPIFSGFSDMKINVGHTGNSLFGVSNDPLMFEGCLLDDQRNEALQNQSSSVSDASSNSKYHSQLLDFSRCNDNWPSAVQSSRIQSDPLTLNDCIKQSTPSNSRGDVSPTQMHMAMKSASTKLPDAGSDLQSQMAPVSHNGGQSLNFTQRQGWNDHEQDVTHNSDLIHSPINSSFSPHGVVEPYGQRIDQDNTFGRKNDELNLYGRSSCVVPFTVQYDKFEEPATEATLKMKEGCLNEPKNSQGSYLYGMGSLEELASMMVRQEQDRHLLKEGKLERHSYTDSLGGCF